MQFHLNGFRTGDPSIAENVPGADDRPSAVDVLIVGCGPAGLTLAAQLSMFADITVRIAERKPGPLEVGQADGIACRSMEMFQAFGFAEKVMKEGYSVNEVTFWRPSRSGHGISRADRIRDVEDDLSEMPHIILSQARVHDFYLEVMRKGPRHLVPEYNRELISVARSDETDYPVIAKLRCLDQGDEEEVIRARYLVGCDGARSRVRAEMGHVLKGQTARQLWGVMDILPRTDFPDIRLKCAIQSEEAGSILIIPREGGYMVRLYIELDALAEGERAADRGVTPELLISKAQQIMQPFRIEAAETAWWSAYEIGQRLCDAFDDVSESERGKRGPRIFIAGDACHTHSPKAGQGMNVSMADGFNLGWKLAAVLRGQARPALLDTYSQERRATARELIDFDRDMARLFSAKPKDTAEAEMFQKYFQKHGRYTAGVETCYAPSLITAAPHHQDLARGYAVGQRFHSAPVVRLADAKPMQLAHAFTADGRWRIVLFAPEGDDGTGGGPVATVCSVLSDPDGLLIRHTPPERDIDSVIDVRAVFPQHHRDMKFTSLPALLRPEKGRLRLTDYEKVYCAQHRGQDIFDLRGIDRNRGALVLVRPDHHVAGVFPLNALADLEAFLGRLLTPV
ncbi:FAD-dependent monooxygenase [Roseobacter sp. WL0113]|uniref:FAD-dependent monooxygenase n=2 Tax=Roseobacter sinensis TaxID=2931391 RepID=A0ABT3BCG2_9RHOB|nr:FAD-dependent monooxygenase [Roseobacter sp. WL0113]